MTCVRILPETDETEIITIPRSIADGRGGGGGGVVPPLSGYRRLACCNTLVIKLLFLRFRRWGRVGGGGGKGCVNVPAGTSMFRHWRKIVYSCLSPATGASIFDG